MSFTIALVEDSAAFQIAIKSIIAEEKDWSLKQVYNNAEAAIHILKDPPDLLILDIQLPGMSGLELLRHLKKTESNMQILICTMYDNDDKIITALENGACGYILKHTTVNDIRSAICDVINGGAPMSPYIAKRVISFFKTPASHDISKLLTQREKDVLRLLSAGFQKKEIADQLSISIETVKKHVSHIYQKLQVQNRVEASNKLKLL